MQSSVIEPLPQSAREAPARKVHTSFFKICAALLIFALLCSIPAGLLGFLLGGLSGVTIGWMLGLLIGFFLGLIGLMLEQLIDLYQRTRTLPSVTTFIEHVHAHFTLPPRAWTAKKHIQMVNHVYSTPARLGAAACFGIVITILNPNRPIVDTSLRMIMTTALSVALCVLIWGLGRKPFEPGDFVGQGITRSGLNALYVSLPVAGIIAGLFSTLVGISGGVFFGVVLGLWSGLRFGGLAYLQHHILLAVLRWNTYIPRNYAHFLDHAQERILLHKIGGGYSFSHPLLQAYFAHMYAHDHPQA